MPFVRMMRMLSAMESGQLSGAALEALLQEPGRVGELQVMLGERALWKRMKLSSATMTALLGSRTATATALANATARADIVASSTFMAQLAESAPAKMALSDSNAALLAVAATPGAVAALRSASKYALSQFAAASSVPNLALPGERYILLGASTSASASGWNLLIGTFVNGSAGYLPLVYSSATALSSNYAASLKAPYTVTMTNQLNGFQVYLGLLRCDI